MKKLFLILLSIFTITPFAHAVDVTLAWDAVIDPTLAGYNLYYGIMSRTYGTPINAGNVTQFKLTGLPIGKTAYFAVTAYDKNKNESSYSVELVGYTIDPSVSGPGEIKPATTVIVSAVYPITFTFTPSVGGILSDVLVDGKSVGKVSSYLFTGVSTNHTILAKFITKIESIPQTNWTLIHADSEETVGEKGKAINAFDGNVNTIWHTQYTGSIPGYPHDIQIDLGAVYDINGFRYLPRQDDSVNGTIKQYAFYVSNDRVDWGPVVASGDFTKDKFEKEILFSAVKGRYIKLVALSEINGDPWASAAEINILGTVVSPTELPIITGLRITQ